ncbi:hypothetical protein D3C75_1059210 [compost metagenome]
MKELMDCPIFCAPQQVTSGMFDCTPCTSYLLIISYDGAWHLIMDDKTKVCFVIAHSQRGGRYQDFDSIREQVLLKAFSYRMGVRTTG